MAFTVEDLTDLIAILEQKPEWRERLRQILLTKELLELPQTVERIAQAVERLTQEAEESRKWRMEIDQWRKETDERWQQVLAELREMREWQRETIEWQRSVTDWQKQVTEQLQQIVEWQREVTLWIEDMNRWRQKVDNDLARLKGSDRERYYRDKAHAIFGRLVRRGKDATPELMERLWDALKAGKISRKEMNALSDADVLWMGEYEGVPVLFVCKVSFTVSGEDVIKAVHRCEIARKLGYKAVPIVAGVEVPEEVFDQAKVVNVIAMTDGDFDYEYAEQILKQSVESPKDEPSD
ncbi:MAG: hypothetical protein RMK94_10370 [Armatimonadota bacterium]|nr:hypothetical protein [Armatimonadota bacterium]